MRNFALITALLLCSLSWISVSGSESQPLEVQPGENVTLLCSNFTSSPAQIIWFRVVNRTLPRVVSYMFNSLESASYSEGFRNGRFVMSSNSSTIFLNIKQVESSDSGLYFCGYSISQNPVITSTSYLQVQEVFDGTTKLMSVILGSLTVLLLMIVICLAVKIKKLQTAQVEERNPQRSENVDSDDLKDAALSLYSATIRNRRPASERQVETRVFYTASR